MHAGKAAEETKSLAAAGGVAQRVVEDPRVIKIAAERTAGEQAQPAIAAFRLLLSRHRARYCLRLEVPVRCIETENL